MFSYYYLFDIDGSLLQQGPVTTLQRSDMGLIFRGITKTVEQV